MHKKFGLSLSVYADDVNMVAEKKLLKRCGKFQKDIDGADPTPIVAPCVLGMCAKRDGS